MLASLGGALALLLGLAVLLLPLLTPELSRPRDALWGAVVLLLGLVLVTSADRLTGAPMLGVLCGGLLIGRLGLEVAQARWFRLLPEERQQLWSAKRWQATWAQLSQASAKLLALVSQSLAGLVAWIGERRQPRSGKRWVRPEQAGSETGAKPGAEPEAEPAAETSTEPQSEPHPDRAPDREAALEAPLEDAPDTPLAAPEAESMAAPEPAPTTWISSLAELDQLLDQAEQTPAIAEATNSAPAGSDEAAALTEPAAASANAAANPPEPPAASDQAG
jgi:hypothetical protein